MKTHIKLALVALIFATTSSYSGVAEESAQSRVKSKEPQSAPFLKLEHDGLSAKTEKLFAVASTDCKCSEWKKVTTKECVRNDNEGNCAKYETVTRKECVAWDHCH